MVSFPSGPSGMTRLTLTIEDATLKKGCCDIITMTQAQVSDGVSMGTSITFPSPGLDIADAQWRHFLFDFDITGATISGKYQKAKVRLTAENL